ncbi:hypothetical protein A6E01_20205 (plasmid) [Vibrio breoganii]|uniref:Uncharacterized protein n=1 Tax=Vibrio breoganii TaxID=553239 RepID=A0AAN0XZV1_9VIBR|nr:hypothetical protein [Vibrio breoganii]ANO35537.1 hypothetical protein A6E01_20205 [Vibrio breoganii]
MTTQTTLVTITGRWGEASQKVHTDDIKFIRQLFIEGYLSASAKYKNMNACKIFDRAISDMKANGSSDASLNRFLITAGGCFIAHTGNLPTPENGEIVIHTDAISEPDYIETNEPNQPPHLVVLRSSHTQRLKLSIGTEAKSLNSLIAASIHSLAQICNDMHIVAALAGNKVTEEFFDCAPIWIERSIDSSTTLSQTFEEKIDQTCEKHARNDTILTPSEMHSLALDRKQLDLTLELTHTAVLQIVGMHIYNTGEPPAFLHINKGRPVLLIEDDLLGIKKEAKPTQHNSTIH